MSVVDINEKLFQRGTTTLVNGFEIFAEGLELFDLKRHRGYQNFKLSKGLNSPEQHAVLFLLKSKGLIDYMKPNANGVFNVSVRDVRLAIEELRPLVRKHMANKGQADYQYPSVAPIKYDEFKEKYYPELERELEKVEFGPKSKQLAYSMLESKRQTWDLTADARYEACKSIEYAMMYVTHNLGEQFENY